jgi:hypothetical protein
MAWANAAEILQQEIARIRLSMTSCDDNLVNNEYDIVGLREDMLYLATLTKRYIDVFRFNRKFDRSSSAGGSISMLLFAKQQNRVFNLLKTFSQG